MKLLERREVIRGGVALGGALGFHGVDQLWSFFDQVRPTPASIGFAEGQKLKPSTRTGVVVLPGQFINNTQDVATALTPSLKVLGPVMYARYGNTQIDVPGLENALTRIQDSSKMKTLSLFCDSDGLDVAGELIPKIGDRFNFDYIFADCSPDDLSDARLYGLNDIAELYVSSPYGESGLVTALGDLFVNHNPDAPYSSTTNLASPGLAFDQEKTLDRGKEINEDLGEYIKQYDKSRKPKIKVVFLRPRNQAADADVYIAQAERKLGHIFPGMKTVEVGGAHQGHDNPVVNSVAYNNAIRRIIATLG